MEVFPVEISDPSEPHPSGKPSFTNLDRASHEYLADRAFALTAVGRISLPSVRNIGFVCLDDTFQRRAVRIDHSTPQLVQ